MHALWVSLYTTECIVLMDHHCNLTIFMFALTFIYKSGYILVFRILSCISLVEISFVPSVFHAITSANEEL